MQADASLTGVGLLQYLTIVEVSCPTAVQFVNVCHSLQPAVTFRTQTSMKHDGNQERHSTNYPIPSHKIHISSIQLILQKLTYFDIRPDLQFLASLWNSMREMNKTADTNFTMELRLSCRCSRDGLESLFSGPTQSYPLVRKIFRPYPTQPTPIQQNTTPTSIEQ